MINPIVVLSGSIASGKSTLAESLVQRFGFRLLKTNRLLQRLGEGNVDFERMALQDFGEKMDQATGGDWIRQEIERQVETGELDLSYAVVIDAVRIEGQIEALRKTYANRIVHVHAWAPVDVLAKRFSARRRRKFREAAAFEETQRNPTEIAVNELGKIADVVVNTDRCTPEDVVTRVASHLGLFGREPERHVDVLIGGQYGSEGKGHIASFLAPDYDVLVRVGGPNAGHKVFHPQFTFHHLPSGTLHNTNAKIVLGPGAVLNLRTGDSGRPRGLLDEISACRVGSDRLVIDPHAMIIEPEDIESERLLEETIASTRSGVGYATARRIVNRHNYSGVLSEVIRKPLRSGTRLERVPVRFAKDIKDLNPYTRRSAFEVLEQSFAAGDRVFLEGTQGTALSLYHGHYPHVTSRDTTVAGCLAEAGISVNRVRKVVMVCRTYPIRVGDAQRSGKTSGYMSQPVSLKTIAERSGIAYKELKRTERTSTTNRDRRIAEFDWVLLRRSATLNAPTDIALSFADYISVGNRDARRFEQLNPDTINFIEEVEKVASAPVSLISTRFHTRSIIDRRTW